MARRTRKTYEEAFEACLFERGSRAKKVCQRVAERAAGRGGRGLGAPAGLEIREKETGAKTTFQFEAYLDGRQVGRIYASKSKVDGRVAYAVRDVDVNGEFRRQGIATALYEAAAQEACRRRARLASVERTPNAHSHNFWGKQYQKGRAKMVGRGRFPKYVLDCEFARDLSGLDAIDYDKSQQCGLPYERFRTQLTFGDGYEWLGFRRDAEGESRKGRPSAKSIARALAKAKRDLHREYDSQCETARVAEPTRDDCGRSAPVCSPTTQPCGKACIPLTKTCRREPPHGACSTEEAWGRFASEAPTDYGDAWEPDAELFEADTSFDFAGLGALRRRKRRR